MKCFTPTLLTALVALAPLSFVTAEPPEIAVQMTQAKSFEPKTITVKTGDTVVWKNVSDMPHSVTDVPRLGVTARDAALPPKAKEFDSGLIEKMRERSGLPVTTMATSLVRGLQVFKARRVAIAAAYDQTVTGQLVSVTPRVAAADGVASGMGPGTRSS